MSRLEDEFYVASGSFKENFSGDDITDETKRWIDESFKDKPLLIELLAKLPPFMGTPMVLELLWLNEWNNQNPEKTQRISAKQKRFWGAFSSLLEDPNVEINDRLEMAEKWVEMEEPDLTSNEVQKIEIEERLYVVQKMEEFFKHCGKPVPASILSFISWAKAELGDN